MKRRIANHWRPVFLLIPRRSIAATAQGDEVTVSWIWGKAFIRYSVFQGRYLGFVYSKSDK